MKSFRFFNSQKLLFTAVLALSALNSYAQKADSTKTDRLSLNVNALSFFRNTEYFNEFIDGYTLPGFWVEPRIQFESGKTKLSAGADFVKLGGGQGFKRIYPVFTAQQEVVNGFTVVVGTINGREKHNSPQPLYRYDNQYDGSPEYGLQLLFDFNKLKGDVWINWEQYIEQGDTIQERFTQGMNWNISLVDNGLTKIDIPIVSMFMHRGGQINIEESFIQTLWNTGTGISSRFSIENDNFKYIDLSVMGFRYADLSPTKREAYKSGNAIMPQAALGFRNWRLEVGSWFSSTFLTPRGVGLFSSSSLKTPGLTKAHRAIAYGSANYEFKLKNGLTTKAGAEAYFDLDTHKLDYCYGISLLFDRNFFLSHL